MSGLFTCLLLLLSSAVAALVVGREEAEGRYQLNHRGDWTLNRRFQQHHQEDPQEVASNDFNIEMKGKDIKRLNSVFHTISGWQSKAKTSSIRRSCWLKYFPKCPKASSSPRSLHLEDSFLSGRNKIIQKAVRKAFGY